MKKILIAFLVFLSILFLTPSVFAADYFTRDYHVLYQVNDEGKTSVTVNVRLTNTTSDYYASSDTITVGFRDIENVLAKDPDGAISPIVKQTDEGTSIEVPFHKKAVGKGKFLDFSVSFDTGDIAEHAGKIWEVNIPGIANADEFASFNVEAKIPNSFGVPTFIKPVSTSSQLVFNKEQLKKSGVSLLFGKEQYYAFSLVYHLKNNNVFPIKTEIALPPATNYQEVSLDSISPTPSNVVVDKDGNWLAQYSLAPAQKIDVEATGVVKVSYLPKPSVLSRQDRQEYTKEKPYWQANNAKIKKLASELKTPESIYQYVIETLHYDFNRVTDDQPRLGALAVLDKPESAVCLEFTDLFIALSRAAGIPAREVNGYAHTENAKQRPLSLLKDILHSWPEYYDDSRQAWIMVDPTWGNTTGGTDYFHTFDLDHIVFVRKGVNSQYPIPPGGYKSDEDFGKKDITVGLAQDYSTGVSNVSLTTEVPQKTFSALPIQGSLTIVNKGNTHFAHEHVVIESPFLLPKRQLIAVSEIPPFGSVKIPFSFAKTTLFTNNMYDFTIKLQDTIIHKRVTVTPFAFSQNQLIGGVIFVIFTIIIFVLAIKTRYLPIFRRK
ncbi:MAG: transglutaminase family protein [Candidatus Levybacteria bacterium]|nr:transglutaminase family protein [Candidatus Levybacteria bacterium]